MPASKRPRRRIVGQIVTGVALAAGLALGWVLLSEYGVERVFGLIARAGWGLLVVASVHVGQLVLTGAAWRLVSPEEVRPSLRAFTVLRWLREGINSLLPVLPVAGLLAAIRLLMRRGLSLPAAVASVLTDSSVELITQIAFTLLGVLLLVLARGAEALAGWMAAGLGGLMIAAALLLPANGWASAGSPNTPPAAWAGRGASRGCTRRSWRAIARRAVLPPPPRRISGRGCLAGRKSGSRSISSAPTRACSTRW